MLAAVSGSAASILGTHTLFVAVGVHPAGLAAAATHWLTKDGVGQAMGALCVVATQQRNYDAAPKTWRVVAAGLLDAAVLLEVAAASQQGQTYVVLGLACLAGVVKNVGWLTSSASRAALHQALTSRKHANLAAVTAAGGAQMMVAGIVGTALGLSLAPWCQQASSGVGMMVYSGLVGMHQLGTYHAVRAVVLTHLNTDRLEIVLKRYIEEGQVMSPAEVAPLEHILQSPANGSKFGIVIGKGVIAHQHNDQMDSQLIQCNYVISTKRDETFLTFSQQASPRDQIVGFYEAVQFQRKETTNAAGPVVLERLEKAKKFLAALDEAGWNLSASMLEPGDAVQLEAVVGEQTG